MNKPLSYYFIWIYYKNNADVYKKNRVYPYEKKRNKALYFCSRGGGGGGGTGGGGDEDEEKEWEIKQQKENICKYAI